MADRTTNKTPPYSSQPRSGTASYIVANGVSLGIGALVQLEGGYLDHWDGTGDYFVGILVGGGGRHATTDVVVGNTSATPPVEGIVDESGRILAHVAVAGTVAQTDVGALVYCADSDVASLTKTDAANKVVGRLVRFRSTSDCDVQLFTPAEWLAGVASGTWLA